MLSFAFALGAPAKGPPARGAVNDPIADTDLVCGAYGDPHIIRSDGNSKGHMGQGEYQLLSLPALLAEVHYYGCGIVTAAQATAKFPHGTYIGALAMKIADTTIEIVGNDLSVVGGASYSVDWNNDAAQGPYTVEASSTTITIMREQITVYDLHKAQYKDLKATSDGQALYRWSITTSNGMIVHSHAVPNKVTHGGWVLDMHVSYPGDSAGNSNGLCQEQCVDCNSSSSCMPINSSATYGIAPVFSDATAAKMATECPSTTPDEYCAPEPPTDLDALCEHNNITMKSALLACLHLSGMADSSFHDACIFDVCMDGVPDSSHEWLEEHIPANDTTCKAVGDPVITAFTEYKFKFTGDGVYEVLDKASSGASDPCAVEVQALICQGSSGLAYMDAIAVVAQGGSETHEVVLGPGATCTIDGVACSGVQGLNQGTDGVTLVPYTPTTVYQGYPSMGEYGVGVTGWYVYAGGFKVNVTMTVGPDGENMMNMIAAAPPMCLSNVTGLCATTATDFTEHQKTGLKGRKQAALVADELPTKLPTYPGLDSGNMLPGLSGLSCPK